MSDNRDINLQSTKRQKRILPEDSFGDWKWREGLAELMVPIIGSLYRNGTNILIYGKSLVNESPVAIMKAHRFARQSDNNELSELETYPILKYIETLDLADCEIDVGEIAVKCPFFEDIKNIEHINDDLPREVLLNHIKLYIHKELQVVINKLKVTLSNTLSIIIMYVAPEVNYFFNFILNTLRFCICDHKIKVNIQFLVKGATFCQN